MRSFLIVVLLSMPLAQCTGKVQDHQASGKRRGSKDSGPTTVEVITGEKRQLPSNISVVTALSGRFQADVFPKVTGRISAFGPKEGEAIKEGEVLFRVDRNDPGESFLSTPVVSPLKGWVGRWYPTSLGEQVGPQSAVVTVVDDEFLKATVYLPTREWLLVTKDTAVTATIGEEKRPGAVATIARAADAGSGRGSVVVEIPNQDHRWRAGMVAKIILGLSPRDRIVIPSTALTITDSGAFIYIVKDGMAERRTVQFMMIDADSVEVLEGLQGGEQVVTAGMNLLSDKAPVQIAAAVTPAADDRPQKVAQ